MKRNILYGILVLVMALMSCRQDPDDIIAKTGAISLKVEVDPNGSGLQTDTRSIIVDHLQGENQVNNLYLLFFTKATDESTSYKGYYKIDGPVVLDRQFAFNYNDINTGNYSILAFANIDDCFINSSTLSAGSLNSFLNSLTGKTEEEVIKSATLYLDKVTNGYATQILKQDNLVMSGRTEKKDGNQLITLKLTRAVSRFDIQILDSGYELSSVSIWNNASSTPLWLSSSNASEVQTVNPGRFYGITFPAGTRERKGGFYAFENYISNPKAGDKKTTCLVVGVQPSGGGTTQYYRINIHPEQSGQSIKRNYVYQVTVRSVLGSGAATEEAAANSTVDPNLEININNWGLDEEGMILTDGKNTLAIPSKIIRFAQDGGTRKYTIFTQGEGVLSMSPNLPSGLTATLAGNDLTITATNLGSLSKREGTIDISFAGLKGTVQVIQEPKLAHFLKLDKTAINNFPTTKSTPFTGVVNVSSSKNWEAKIYNAGGSSFSFSANDATALTTSGISGDNLNIYVTEDNLTNKLMAGFVLVSLKDEPGYSRVVILKQTASVGISIDLGELTELRFEGNGAPKTIANAIPGEGYELEVHPGTDTNGNYNSWGAELQGANASKFVLLVDKNSTLNRVTVYPKGNTDAGTPHAQYPYYNFTDNIIDGVELVVYWGDNLAAVATDQQKCKKVAVLQETMVFNVPTTTIISKVGQVKDIPIDIPKGSKWQAEIIENFTTSEEYGYMPHKGYIYDGANKLTEKNEKITGQTSTTLKVGFDKLLFPIVEVQPVLTLKISLENMPEFSSVIEVKQEALSPRTINILNTVGGQAYSSLNDGSFSKRIIDYYNSAHFSTSASAKCYADFVKVPKGDDKYPVDNFNATTGSPQKISELGYNYVHAGYTKNNWTQAACNELELWRQKTDGVMFIIQDYSSSNALNFFQSLNSATGYVDNTHSSNEAIFEINSPGKRVLYYLYNHGPFGEVMLADMDNKITDMDNVHSAISRTSVTPTGTAVLSEKDYADGIVLFIDPDQKIVYLGESQLFSDSSFSPNNIDDSNAANRSASRFLGNLLSYIIRAAQYGSHFTDHFKHNSTTYPFAALKKDPMFD
ncbi:hypothetical protein D0T85_20305 [Bacteroides sp. 519]|nr:hypothetical protein [Bacteroides sp. 519]